VSGKCEECGGKRYNNMDEHIRVYHTKVKTLSCDVCGKLFLTTSRLNTHKKTHLKNKEICMECGVVVINLRQHQRFVHEKDHRFKCDEPGCETKFTSTHGLKKHIESVHQMVREICSICQKQVINLKKHIQIVHERLREHKCPECLKDFQSRTHLRNHISRVHLGLRVKCPECGKMVQDVRNHINFVHKKVANFPCDQCSTTCLTSTALKLHVSSVHLKEKTPCPQCGITVTSAYLAAHMRRKHGNKPKSKLVCTHCEKCFPTAGQLAKHVSRVHMSVREKCSICGLMTKDLKRHNRNTNCGREGYILRAVKDEVPEDFNQQSNVKKRSSSKGIIESETEDWENMEDDVFEESDDKMINEKIVMNNNTSTNAELWIKSEIIQLNAD